MRKGMGRGKGKGYKNLMGKDPRVHSDSAKGRKQPQRISMAQKIAITKNLNLKDSDGDKVADKFDCKPFNPNRQDEVSIKIYPNQTSKLYDKWEKDIVKEAVSDVLGENTVRDFYDDYQLAEFVSDEINDFKLYQNRYSSDELFIVKDIKGKGFPDYDDVMEKVAKELNMSVEDVKTQFSQSRFDSLFWDDLNYYIEDLKNQDELGFDAEDFAVVGRSGGYWGLRYKNNMVEFDKDAVKKAVQKKYKEDKENILKDTNYNIESYDNKSDFIYEVTKNFSIDDQKDFELRKLNPETKKQFKAVNDFIEDSIKHFESSEKWVEDIIANEYIGKPLTPIEKAQQEPSQKKLNEPYYMEGNLPLRNDGGQTPPP